MSLQLATIIVEDTTSIVVPESGAVVVTADPSPPAVVQVGVGMQPAPLGVSSSLASALTSLNWFGVKEWRVTLDAPSWSPTFAGAVDGQVCTLTIAQDATGGRSVTLPASVVYPTGIASPYVPTSAPNASDVLSMVYHQPSAKFRILSIAKGY